MTSSLMQYVQTLNEVKHYLRITKKRLVYPLIDMVSVSEHNMICEMWTNAIIKPYDEKFRMLTTNGYKNNQDCIDALDDLNKFKRCLIEVLEYNLPSGQIKK